MRKLHCLLAKISRWLLPALPIISALALVAMFAEPALAAGPDDWSAWTGPVALILSGVIMIIVLFAFIFAIFLGDLMDSTYILDSGMGDTLHLVWEVVRNFVNIGFILILLIIAAMVIFGGGGERGLGLLKKVLPKFILALILVNFTFFAARFVLTTNDVLATAIFSLPRTISGEQKIRMPCDPSSDKNCLDQIKDTMKTAAKGNAAASEKISAITKAITAKTKDGSPRWFPQTVKQLSLGKKNMSLVLLSSMIDLEHIVHIKGVNGDGTDLAIAAIGTLIVAGAVGIIFFMLFLAFVVRMVVLWVAIAISPLAALGIVLKELIPGIDMGKGGFDPVKVFISHAFMPTMVAIPLSIGMIMIFANNAVGYDISTGWIKTFSSESGEIHALLWWIASIVVIWFGTNKMIKEASPDFAAKLTDGIHGGVNKFVGGTAGLLKYAPIIPAWQGNGKMSMADMSSLPGLARGKLQAHTQPARTGSSEVLARAAGGWAGYKPTAPTGEDFKRVIKDWGNSKDPKSHQEDLREHGHNYQQLGGGDFELDKTLKKHIKEIHPELAGMIDNQNITKMSEVFKELGTRKGEDYAITGEKMVENEAVAKSKKKDAGMFEDEGKSVSKDKEGTLVDGSGKTYDKAKAAGWTDAKEEKVFILEKKEADGSTSEYYATKTGEDNYSIIINAKDKEQLQNNINMQLEEIKNEKNAKKVEGLTQELMKYFEKWGRVGTQDERDELFKKLDNKDGVPLFGRKNKYDFTTKDFEDAKKALGAK